jgi:hypothetical protein
MLLLCRAALYHQKERKNMPKVDFRRENIARCLCGQCPVQVKSRCAHDLYEKVRHVEGLPEAGQLPGLYCSTGRSSCTDLDAVQQCMCPICPVWADYRLTSNHYCIRGSAEKKG